MKVQFKALIPSVVKKWIYEQEFEEPLIEAEKRLGWKLNVVEEFKLNGTISDVELEEKQMIGNCSIVIDADNEEEARKKFNKIFYDIAKKGQKFKITAFVNVD